VSSEYIHFLHDNWKLSSVSLAALGMLVFLEPELPEF